MPKTHYHWQDSNNKPPIIEPHSIAKHEVLRNYLIRYIQVLASNQQYSSLRLVLVDGFAGGGLYRRWDNDQEYEGSPLIMMRAAHDAANLVNEDRKKQFELKPSFIFVEKNIKGFQSLERVIHGSDLPFVEQVSLHYGCFTEKIIPILQDIQSSQYGRAIFLLDQYGYTDVPMSAIKTIFHTLPKAEVLLTFSVDAMMDYFDSTRRRGILDRIGLEQHIQADSQLLSRIARKQKIQMELGKGIHHESGAAFYTPFFIRSAASPRGYWFIHLSNHFRARDEMIKLHWNMHTHFIHYGNGGLSMLAYDPRHDSKLTGEREFIFGKTERDQSVEQLQEDIPKYIVDTIGQKGVTLEQFLHNKFNDTPADVNMIKEVLGASIRERDLLVYGPNGETRRSGSAITQKDIICPNPQQKLPLIFR
ncbi:MAG: three-Cys-motif partner protein TcmP [Magnetococcales bacterium]|nr:three-Cys-motif partner protein TcmP [Magnetococcales bacterium]